MGSSLTSLQATILAVVFGVFYLLFDSVRFFVNQAGPVKVRRWTSDPGNDRNGGSWFAYSPQVFSLITGALLQIFLVAAVCFSLVALVARYNDLVEAEIVAVLVWCLIAIAWKIGVALIPEAAGEALVRAFLPVSRIFYYLFWPLLYPIRTILARLETRREETNEEEEVTVEQVQAYIDVGEEEGILEKGEGKLIQSIVDFGDRIARELMTPRVDVLAFEVNGSVAELARLFSESKYSRIPIYEGNIDKVVGVVHVKDLFDVVLLDHKTKVRELARPALFVPETKMVSELLRDFQIEHLQIAVVVDEYGGTAGVVTIEDVVEQIVGEISDEHEDTDESIVEVENGVYLVNGAVKIDNLEGLVGVEIHGDDYETVAGLIFTQMGRVPKVGEVTKKRGLIFEVEKADRKRIYRVKVSRDPDYRPSHEDHHE